ncbi:hypothetical protein [Altererythrobacter ishigakiensis]|uniref:Uncharacterized protein n=1 Tax=Altererythrobacter ishigakiensis TaxID=476157 RepID=A0A562UVX8_9SPHN|nr:hypothetical protein [Altererythrobacter ishigakiensis]TWJ09782.1 hypothetical protein JN10_1428 [Altererythrobacter ishigakiensis]
MRKIITGAILIALTGIVQPSAIAQDPATFYHRFNTSKERGSLFYWFTGSGPGSLYFWRNGTEKGSAYYRLNGEHQGSEYHWLNGRLDWSLYRWHNGRGGTSEYAFYNLNFSTLGYDTAVACLGARVRIEVCDHVQEWTSRHRKYGNSWRDLVAQSQICSERAKFLPFPPTFKFAVGSIVVTK